MLQWRQVVRLLAGRVSMSQLRVFLSHSSQDKPFADALVRALRQAGAGHLVDEI